MATSQSLAAENLGTWSGFSSSACAAADSRSDHLLPTRAEACRLEPSCACTKGAAISCPPIASSASRAKSASLGLALSWCMMHEDLVGIAFLTCASAPKGDAHNWRDAGRSLAGVAVPLAYQRLREAAMHTCTSGVTVRLFWARCTKANVFSGSKSHPTGRGLRIL